MAVPHDQDTDDSGFVSWFAVDRPLSRPALPPSEAGSFFSRVGGRLGLLSEPSAASSLACWPLESPPPPYLRKIVVSPMDEGNQSACPQTKRSNLL